MISAAVCRHPAERAASRRAVQHARINDDGHRHWSGRRQTGCAAAPGEQRPSRIVQAARMQDPAVVAAEGRGAVQRDRPQILRLGGGEVAEVGGEQGALEGVRRGRRGIERQRLVDRRPHRRHRLARGEVGIGEEEPGLGDPVPRVGVGGIERRGALEQRDRLVQAGLGALLGQELTAEDEIVGLRVRRPVGRETRVVAPDEPMPRAEAIALAAESCRA